jgi:hypothetical protein
LKEGLTRGLGEIKVYFSGALRQAAGRWVEVQFEAKKKLTEDGQDKQDEEKATLLALYLVYPVHPV